MQANDQTTQLAASRRFATGLLVLMAIILVIARIFQARLPWLSFVVAFAEAAMVGGLADWFAITALFRSPLGLPIPHTAIIPRNKDRIGESLSDFLEHNFLTPEIIRSELQAIDFAGIAAAWLEHPENRRMVSRQALKTVPVLLRVIEDDDVRQFLYQRVKTALDKVEFAKLLAEVLSLVVASKHHQALFDRLIDIAARALEHNKPYIRWRIRESSPRWLPSMVDEKVYERLLEAARATLDEMREDDSEWRLRFHNAVEGFIKQLRTSPEYEAKIGALARDLAGHPAFRDYLLKFWTDSRARLEHEASQEDSPLAARLDQTLAAFGRDLLGDPALQARLNLWVGRVAVQALVERRETIADLVARVIHQWDAETISRKLELHVGKDLQYIRINGTLVGGLVGLVLHSLSLVLL